MTTKPDESKALLNNNNFVDGSSSPQSSNYINQRIANMTHEQEFQKNDNRKSVTPTSQSNLESQEATKCNKWNSKHVCLAAILLFVLIIMIITMFGSAIYVMKTMQEISQKRIDSINSGNFIHSNSLVQTSNAEIKSTSPKIVIQPSDIMAISGSTVNLPCQFSSEVKCYWLKDSIVTNDANYYYETSKATRNCSLTIQQVTDSDFASWMCGSYDHNLQSNKATIKEAVMFTVKPSNQTTQLGENIILNCKFSKAVACVWLRNENAVTIGDRYVYVSDDQPLKTDCSIKIDNVKSIDLTSWSCGVTSDYDNENLMSGKVFIDLKRAKLRNKEIQFEQKIDYLQIKEPSPISFKKVPKNVASRIGSTIKLDCQFFDNVSCAWLRNDNHVDIQGRYSYIDQSDKQNDCSLQITNLRQTDDGQWQCVSMGDSNSDSIYSNTITVVVT